MKTAHMIYLIKEFFHNNGNKPSPMNVILDYVNKRDRIGSNKASMNNILGKNKLIFEKVGKELISQIIGGRREGNYTRALWKLKELDDNLNHLTNTHRGFYKKKEL